MDKDEIIDKDEVLKMARQAGLCHDVYNGIFLCAPVHLEAFVKLVAKEAANREREACEEALKNIAYSGESKDYCEGVLASLAALRERVLNEAKV